MADQPERKKLSLNINPTGGDGKDDPTGPLPRQDSPNDQQPKIEPPPSPIEAPETDDSAIVDPQSARDFETTRLKRVKPEEPKTDPDTEPTAPTDEKFSTSTVHLKVIKEKKKQLAGILSASQTIRLRPAGGGEGNAPTEGGRKTLKIKAPITGDAPAATSSQEDETDAIPKPQFTTSAPKPEAVGDAASPTTATPAAAGPPAAAAPPAAAGPPAAAAPPATGGRATLKIKAPTGVAPAAGAPAPATGASEKRATLKIKVPPPTTAGAPAEPAAPAAPAADTAAADKQKSTLKIKAPVPTGTAPAAAPAAAPVAAPVAAPAPTAEATPATTMEQPAQAPGRTLKLKTTPKTADTPAASEAAVPAAPGTPPHSEDAPQPEVKPSAKTKDAKASPGIVYTLATAASIAIVGVTVFLFFTHFSDMFGSPFGQ